MDEQIVLFVYFLKTLVYTLLILLQFAMLIRALLSWFPTAGEGKIATFLNFVTEPFIIPVRSLLNRFELVRSMPIDISFFVTFLIISIVTTFLS